jgi:DNA topoisomerase-1
MDSIVLEEALELFKLPRDLGETPDGEPVQANIGRFGPYVRWGKRNFVSITEPDEPYSITLERALELVAEKKAEDANRVIKEFPEVDIQVLRGRYGPYITDGKKNGRIPKDKDPESLTQEECEQIIAAAPARKKRGRRKKKTSASA